MMHSPLKSNPPIGKSEAFPLQKAAGEPNGLTNFPLETKTRGIGEEVRQRLSGRLGRYASKSRCNFPGEEIWLDPLLAHTDFSAYIPSPG